MEVQKVKDYNQELTLKLKNLREEIDQLKFTENSKNDDYVYLNELYEEQKKKIVELGLGKRELETRLQELEEGYKGKAHELKTGYDMTIKEMSEDIKGLQEAYEKKIREINNETRNLREESRHK